MAERLEMLSVDQLNNAVSLVNAITGHDKPSGSVANPMPQCLSQGKDISPSPAIISASGGPVILSMNHKSPLINMPGTKAVHQQNFIQSGLALPVISTDDKPIIIGRPVQPIQAFTSCQISTVMTIPTFTNSCQGSTVITTPSTCFQQQPIQIQTPTIAQNLPECLLSSNINGIGQTLLPSSASSLIIGDDGTLQISSGTTSGSPLIVSSKLDQPVLTEKAVCPQSQQQQQQPLVFIAPTNSNSGVTLLGNTVGPEQNAHVVLEVVPSSGPVLNSGLTHTLCATKSVHETTSVQSVSATSTQAGPSVKVITRNSSNNMSPTLQFEANKVCNVASKIINSNASHTAMPTIVVKKTLRKCHSGTVLEMVEKLQPASAQIPVEGRRNIDTLIATGSYCVECDKMYGKEDGECATHNCPIIEVADTPVLTRARMSLPSQLQLKNITVPGLAQEGIFTCDNILKKKTRFGPLVGQLQSIVDVEIKEDLPMRWKIFNKGKCNQVYDCSQEELSNWMHFVRRANADEDQNVVAYQQGQDIWFITVKDILPNTELLYWYSNEYSTLLGARKRPGDLFKCGVCGKESQDYAKLQSHVTYMHSSSTNKNHQCHICARSFPGKAKLNTHVLGHLGVKPYICNVCGKQFSDQSNLRLHKDIHTGEKRFHCGQCGRAFRQKAHLVTHYLVHTGEKKLQCKFCEKTFARASDLRSHERALHTKDKKFVCMVPTCHKVFHKLSVLKKHMLIHSNKKDFSCSLCKKTFLTKYHLTRHAKACKGSHKGKRVKDYPDYSANQEDSSSDGVEVS